MHFVSNFSTPLIADARPRRAFASVTGHVQAGGEVELRAIPEVQKMTTRNVA